MKAFMGARSPAATYASFRMRSSSRLSCCTAGRARAFTVWAKVTSSVASSWWGKRNQRRKCQVIVGREREGGQVEKHGGPSVPMSSALAGSPTNPPHCGAEGSGRAEHKTDAGPGSQCAAAQGGKTWQSLSSQSWALPGRPAKISVGGRASEPEERNGEHQNYPHSPLYPILTKLIFLGTLT